MNANRPLIAHVLYRLDTGGMERFVVTLVNHTRERYRHALISLTGFGSLRDEIQDAEVACVSLDKRPGKDWPYYLKLWRALRALGPDLVQTYNTGTVDIAPVARLAGVRRVVHAERGRDAADPHGENRRHRRLRRWCAPFITRYLAVSRDLERWLVDPVGIDPSKVMYIPNGIDARRFLPFHGPERKRALLGEFAPPGTLLIVTIGRLDPVKDHAGLINAFHRLCEADTQTGARLRLVIIGGGRQRENLEQQVERLGLSDRVRLLGERAGTATLLAECDIFALSSIAEGMPGVLLEAMASGLPVVATDVGGVAEVVADGVTGTLVAPADPAALAAALDRYVRDPELRQQHGRAGLARVETTFSLPAMISAYTALYDELLGVDAEQPAMPPVELARPGEH